MAFLVLRHACVINQDSHTADGRLSPGPGITGFSPWSFASLQLFSALSLPLTGLGYFDQLLWGQNTQQVLPQVGQALETSSGDGILGSHLLKKHFSVILGDYNDKGTLTLTLVMQDLATYFFEHLRGQMGQITTLMGLDAFDPEMTLSWIEPCPDVLPLKGGRAVQRGLLPGVRQLNSLPCSSASNPFSLDRAVLCSEKIIDKIPQVVQTSHNSNKTCSGRNYSHFYPQK